MARSILVVARYNEDTSWVDKFPGWEIDIIEKGVDMPNIGREPASFLFAMYKHYPKLVNKDVLAFVQGNPFDHCRDLAERLAKPITGFTHLGGVMTCKGDGAPHESHLPVAEKHLAWIGKPAPEDIEFAAGGQFALTARQLKRFPREYYGVLLDESTEGRNPYVFERLWKSLLDK